MLDRLTQRPPWFRSPALRRNPRIDNVDLRLKAGLRNSANDGR